YALGLVLDEMVTPTPAFKAQSLAGLYWEKLREQPVPPGVRARDLPVRWQRIIERCLRTNPRERYQSVLEIVPDLEAENAPERWDRWACRTRFLWRSWRRNVLVASALLMCFPVVLLPVMVWSQAPESVVMTEVRNQTGQPDFDAIASGTSA